MSILILYQLIKSPQSFTFNFTAPGKYAKGIDSFMAASFANNFPI